MPQVCGVPSVAERTDGGGRRVAPAIPTVRPEAATGWPLVRGEYLRRAALGGFPVTDAIVVRDLRKTYGKGVLALDGLSFSVPAGTIFGMLGPNGAGKSTTVRVLTTLSTADSGHAEVCGIDVAERPQEVRRRIGYVGQNSGVDKRDTGRENLILQGRLQGMGGIALARRVDDLMEVIDLKAAQNRLVHTYSGGMRRRLDIAMGLVHRPKVLFLDEPTTGLDPESRAALWSEVRRLSAVESLTILLTTHYLEEVDRLAQAMVIVDQGRVVAEGTPDGLKRRIQGDTIRVQLAVAAQAASARETAERLGLRDAVVLEGGRVLTARAENGGQTVPGLLAALDGAGIRVDEVAVARPSLDAVYLALTGRRIEDAERSATA